MKDEIVRRTKTLRKPSGKKPGGQEGHDGHKLNCSYTPDEIMDDAPSYCTNCGESLADAERVLDYVTQVISIPELKPVIKEIRHYVMVCKNCGERIRTAPRRKSNDVIYDANVKSLVVYLSVIRLRFLLVVVLSRLQWLGVEGTFVNHKKYNKLTGGQETTNPVKTE